MPSQPFRPIDRLEKHPRRTSARRILVLPMLIATGMMLSGCAASMFDSSSSNETMSQSRWDGPMKPRTTRTTFVRNGSQPILPPVPAENDGLPPVRVSSLLD